MSKLSAVRYSSDAVGPLILDALGVPSKNCRSATIRLNYGEPVVVEAEYISMSLPSDGALRSVEAEARKYTLQEGGAS